MKMTIKQYKVFTVFVFMLINIKVKPNSGRQEVEEISSGEYKVYLKSVPENNKANEAIISYLEKLSGKKAKIIKGKTSKKKTILFC